MRRSAKPCELFHKATELDPSFGSAYGMAAYCFLVRRVYLWMTDEAAERAETTRLARRAAESGWDDAVALARGGHALATAVGDLDARHRDDRSRARAQPEFGGGLARQRLAQEYARGNPKQRSSMWRMPCA